MVERNIILLAETGADITRETAERYGIEIVPMHVSFHDATRDDGSFPSEEICAYYDRTGELPKTSGSTPEDFVQAFDRIHDRWPEAQILYLAYSSATTCSFQSAQIASKDRPYVTSIDTKTVTAGQQSIVLRMAQLLEERPEITLEEAVSAARALVDRSRMGFITNDMEYLRAGGRVSNAVALCGRLLNIHPLIELQDGHLVATKKLRGKLEVLVPRLITAYTQEHRLEKEELWLIRSPRFPDAIRAGAQHTALSLGFRKVTWVETGCVITTHCGPSAFGVVGVAAR